MSGNLKFIISTVLLLFAISTPVCSNEDNYLHCQRVVKNWVESSRESGQDRDKLNLKDLLFFLHVPRTGGRTYFHCFLRKLYTSAQECPRSYDKLRFDPSKPNCRLVVSHDDYSLISKLPEDRSSVVTILRNPLDRVFSTYEFSVEVAARFLVHPNLTSAKQMSSRIRPKSRGVSTLDIWPWKYLVPWMREDLFVRRDARKLGKLRRMNEITDPYNMENMVMPLHDFINDPLAHEIVHNGATFQVAGLTNNSYLPEAHEVRECVRKHPTLGRAVLEVAKSRLDQMLYVGLTEDHKKSARLFVNMVGAQVLSQSEALSSSDVQAEASRKTELSSSFPESETGEPDQIQSSNYSQLGTEVSSPTDATSVEANMTVEKLMGAYEECISSLRKSQSTRRSMSLKRIAPANFSKEARLLVPETVLQQIISLNSLDMELYRHAESIFLQQEHHSLKGRGAFMAQQQQKMINTEHESSWNNLYNGYSSGKVFLLTTTLTICLILFVITKRRRTSKLKV
ncbi:protein-tyrosine sulfotransferase-like isoform X1 [Ananas comosus]|uniref:Protein-tyrosine sulfotransferase-like isoform X1 n=1 Tax=Ananas comosus TaxID=4615 RepID=A0A6P5GDN4_ANACO|nr:protein-tyrosine sulfotransferase-like isoform X1 [Ananas comosus]